SAIAGGGAAQRVAIEVDADAGTGHRQRRFAAGAVQVGAQHHVLVDHIAAAQRRGFGAGAEGQGGGKGGDGGDTADRGTTHLFSPVATGCGACSWGESVR